MGHHLDLSRICVWRRILGRRKKKHLLDDSCPLNLNQSSFAANQPHPPRLPIGQGIKHRSPLQVRELCFVLPKLLDDNVSHCEKHQCDFHITDWFEIAAYFWYNCCIPGNLTVTSAFLFVAASWLMGYDPYNNDSQRMRTLFSNCFLLY